MIERAIALLVKAGALPDPVLTPAEAAALVPIGVEAVRVSCRSGLGSYHRPLRCFFIRLSELKAHVLKTRGFVSNALIDFTPTQPGLGLSLVQFTKVPGNAERITTDQSPAAVRVGGTPTPLAARSPRGKSPRGTSAA
jgi:hypothetical protein